VDMHSAQRLGELAGELAAAGSKVQAVEARSSVRDRLRSEGVDEKLGGINRYTSVDEAIAEALAR
jgi:SulP family sulfate permease